MSANPSPDPLISLFAAIRTYAEATALPAPAIYGLRQFFRFITPTPPTTENQNARVFYPRLLDHDDPDERAHDSSSARVTSSGAQTTPAADPLAPDNADLKNLHRCCRLRAKAAGSIRLQGQRFRRRRCGCGGSGGWVGVVGVVGVAVVG